MEFVLSRLLVIFALQFTLISYSLATSDTIETTLPGNTTLTTATTTIPATTTTTTPLHLTSLSSITEAIVSISSASIISTTLNITSQAENISSISTSSLLPTAISTTSTTTPTTTTTAPTTTTTAATTTTAIISEPIITTKNDPALAACLGVLIPLAVIAIIVGVIFYLRNKNNHLCKCVAKCHCRRTNGSIKSTAYSKSCSVNEFLQHVADMEKDSGLRYAEEYGEELKQVGVDQSHEIADIECNRGKNRYQNIKPYDNSLVKLMPIEDNTDTGSDYINASWMPGYHNGGSRREYITTQGPLPSTKDDFWRMIWEYNCRGIVMLTNFIEIGKIKCDRYWPQDNNPVVYGDLEVTVLEEVMGDEWNIRELQISMGQQQKTIKHIHYHVWPDHGVPTNFDSMLHFISVVNNQMSKPGGGLRPLVVHCSAGVGRTGTFIALDTLLRQIEEERSIDIFTVVYRMRMNRPCMVQTEAQYIFIHECIAHHVKNSLGKTNSAFTEDETEGSSDKTRIVTFNPRFSRI